jgi:hypothetical protein
LFHFSQKGWIAKNAVNIHGEPDLSYPELPSWQTSGAMFDFFEDKLTQAPEDLSLISIRYAQIEIPGWTWLEPLTSQGINQQLQISGYSNRMAID